MTRTDRPHAVIIGGAIMGSFTAWQMRNQGFRGPITVIEKDPTYQYCSTALSAAAIRTQFGTKLNVRMSLYGAQVLRDLPSVFGAGADAGFIENGYLILSDDTQAAIRRPGLAMQNASGADIVAMTGPEARARFPFLSDEGVTLATYGRADEGWFDAWSLLSLVRRAARDNDVTYLGAEVTGFRQSAQIEAVQLADGTEIACDICVMAAGAASGRLTALLGQPLPVEPRKRTVFSFRAPVHAPDFPMLFDTSGLWVRPEGEGFIGGIAPLPDQDPDATGDFEPHHDLMEDPFWIALATRIPAMEELRLDRAWAGHYEVNTLDHNGIVGAHDTIPNLYFITGFSGHGVMHAPAAALGLAELIVQGAYRTLDLTPLGYDRIRRNAPMKETVVY